MKKITYKTVPQAGGVFHRAFSKEYIDKKYNDSGRGSRRFDPIKIDGKHVGACYIATSYNIALAETHIRFDVDKNRHICTYKPDDDVGESIACVGQINIDQDITLVDADTIKIKGKSIKKYLSQPNHMNTPHAYKYSVHAAKLLLQEKPDVQGIIYNSFQRQLPGEKCIVLFEPLMTGIKMELINHHELRGKEGHCTFRYACEAVGAEIPTWCIC